MATAKALVCYYSRTGNTKKMAQLIEKGVASGGIEVTTKNVKDVTPRMLLDFDAIVIGSPTYYGLMSAEIKMLLDKSIKYHGELDGKVGGAFASSYNVGGGNETTVLAILEALMIHGMILYGDPEGDHYGPVSIGAPDKRVEKMCIRYGRRIAELAKRLHQ